MIPNMKTQNGISEIALFSTFQIKFRMARLGKKHILNEFAIFNFLKDPLEHFTVYFIFGSSK